MQTVTLLKNDFKKEESRNIDREIALEKKIKQLDNIVYKRDQSAQTVHMLTKPQFFYDHTTKQALGFQNPFYLKKAQQLEPKLYDGNVIKSTSAIVIPDSEETLMLTEESRSKILLNQQDPIVLEKKVNTTLVDYANSMNSLDPSPSCRPTKVEVPKELPKVSMVNTSLKKLKHHLAGFDVVVKERTTATAITEGSWGFEHTKACFRDEIIPFVKALKDIFNTFDQYLIDELTEVQNVFHQMEQAVEQHRLESKTFESPRKKSRVIRNLKERIKSLNGNINEDKVKKDIEEIETINIELDHRVSKLIAENEHLKQTYKQLYDSIKPTRIRSKEQCDALINQVNQKSVEIFDLNVSLQEKDLVITALKDELRKLKGKDLADNVVTKHTIAPEMLKVDVEPIAPKLLNNRTAHSDYLRHTQEQAVILRERTPSSTQKNKVEAHSRTVKSSLKNKDYVVEPNATANVQHSKLNVNSELLYVKCNGCMLSDNHDLCVLNFINDVNARVKSKFVKKSSKRKVWKPTGKVFANIGYNWRPTGRTFTIVGNACPLTRITTTAEVPPRKPTAPETDTPKPVVTLVYLRKPRKSKTNVPVSKPKILKSISANNKEPNNGTEFVNQTLRKYYEKVGISHETFVARSPQQNGVVERRNCTLIEAARTMLLYAKALLFLWVEAVATACYTQNISIIRLHHGKTPYELLHDKLPDLSFFHVFGALCYPTNDSENLGKLQPKADIGIFIGYAPTKKAFRIHNRRTRQIIKTIHVDFDELTTMASEHNSL
ncbi:retrovirus-related pol polyprotein from transposon TNT 1-94 [Tanacetum coccineum]